MEFCRKQLIDDKNLKNVTTTDRSYRRYENSTFSTGLKYSFEPQQQIVYSDGQKLNRQIRSTRRFVKQLPEFNQCAHLDPQKFGGRLVMTANVKVI